MSQPSKSALDMLIEEREQCRATDTSSNPEALKEMLLHLLAPESLCGCVQIACNLKRIFGYVLRKDICEEQHRKRFFLYLRELRWITHNRSRLAQDLFIDDSDRERFLRTERTNPLLRHGAREHGLWCLLWEVHSARESQYAFLTLQLHATLSHLAVLGYWITQEEWLQSTDRANGIVNALYRETLSIRHFVMEKYKDADEHIAVLKGIPTGVSNADLYEYIRDTSAKHKPSEDSKPSTIYLDMVRISWLLHHASHPGKFRFRDRDSLLMPHEVPDDSDAEENGQYGDPYELEGFELEDSLDGDEDDRAADVNSNGEEEEEGEGEDSPEESGIFVTTRRKWSKDQIKACVESGLHPAEVLPSHTMYLSHSKAGHVGARAWVEMDNQLLPWSRDNMPVEIAARGMKALQHAAGSGCLMDLELYIHALVILRTGAPEKTVQSMQVRRDHPSTVDVLTLVMPATADANEAIGEWLIPVLPLPYQNEGVTRVYGCRECVPYFPLPDYSYIGSLMRQLLDRKSGGTWKGEPIRPFDRSTREYQNALKERMRGDSRYARGVLHILFTFSRLGLLQFQKIHDLAAGNTVPATYITQRPRRPGEVPRFYETPAIERLQSLDKQSMASIADELKDAGFHWGIDLSVNCSRSEGFAGSPFCPHVSVLRDYLSNLRLELTASFSGSDKGESHGGPLWWRQHNLITAYTYVGYNIATCHRAVVGGYTDIGRLEPFTGMVTLQDKGNRDRFASITGPVFAQMYEYKRILSCQIYDQLFHEVPRPAMFFLDEDWKIQPISPSTLRPYLPFPPNFGRHFVRTMLAERIYKGEAKISNEHLNELLGHAVEGEERTSQYSSFGYREYASAVRENMSALLSEIDYWPISFIGQRLPVLDTYV